ncbi:MAG: hypothetical protein EZS28_047287, partial [Streblomastix strix]
MTFAEFNKVAPDRTTHSEYKSSAHRNDMNDYRPTQELRFAVQKGHGIYR